MSKRKEAKALAQWHEDTRQWATASARALALDLYHHRPTAIRPYALGLVLDPNEHIWAEVPVRFNLDQTHTASAGLTEGPQYRSWLVTSDRLVGRLADDRLYGYRWDAAAGVRVNLGLGRECIGLDMDNEPNPIWTGPAVAPMAVAAVFHLYGPVGLIEHPALAPLHMPIAQS